MDLLFWTSRHDTACMMSLLRKGFLKKCKFADSHILPGVPLDDGEIIANILLLSWSSILNYEPFLLDVTSLYLPKEKPCLTFQN